MNPVRTTLLVAGVMGLVACGGSGEKLSSKEQTAGVVFGISNASSGPSQGGGNSGVRGAVGAPMNVDCPKGGKMAVTMDMDLGSMMPTAGAEAPTTTGQQGMKMAFGSKYDSCVIEYDNPQTEAVETDELTLNGTSDMSTDMQFSEAGMKLVYTLKGDLTLEGVIEDGFSADVTQTMEMALNGDSAKFALVMDGFVKTATENFEFANESFDFSSDSMKDMAKTAPLAAPGEGTGQPSGFPTSPFGN